MPSKKKPADSLPTTLAEAIRYFADADRAHDFVTKLRFPNGVACPACPRMGCGSAAVGFIATRRMWQCKDCKKQSSVKVGTIFEDSPIGFDKWLPAMWMLAGDRNGISSCELGRALGITQKTAWFMLHRIRLAMKHKSLSPPLSREVEADETFVGGKVKATKRQPGRSRAFLEHGPATGKTTVFGMVERGNPSRVRAMVVPDHSKASLVPRIRENVAPGSMLYTDALRSYRNLGPDYSHAFVDHMVTYVEGRVHTNTIENFWACLKRTVHGTYIAPRPFHMEAYVDEQVFRFNNRELPDGARLEEAFSGVDGRRVTYAQLIKANKVLRLAARARARRP
jgi:transposase-like protein